MPIDLVGALVGWLVSLVGDAGIQLVRRSSDERALRQAIRLAIDTVVEQADPSSSELLRLGLRECFSAPPQLGLHAFPSVGTGLRAAIAAQVVQLDQMMYGDTGQPFYQAVLVDREWLIDQVTAAVLTALPHVAAASSVAELVHVLNAESLSTQLDTISAQISALEGHARTKSDYDGVGDTPSWLGSVVAVPPLRGDEVARPGLMDDLIGAVMRPGASAVGMTTGLWGAGGFGKTTMARLLVHREDIRKRFPDGAVWVTIGEDTAGPELADKVTNAVGLLCNAA